MTGTTGNVGGQVLSQLAVTGAQVRVLVRNPANARFSWQIEIVRGDPGAFVTPLVGVSSGH
ncbi:MAG: hypothetical protein ACRD4F_03485 [Candidatus Angelobacter sp.]